MGIIITRRNQLKEIIKNISWLNIELDWDIDEGVFNEEDYEINVNDYLIRIELHASINGKIINGDYKNPPEFNEKSRSIEIVIKEVWSDEKLIKFNKYQLQKLTEVLKQNINLS